MTINIVPISGTVPRTGKFGVVASHPGIVTLTASDPRCVLTPSSFTVWGTVENWATILNNHGRSNQSIAHKRNNSITFGVRVRFPTYCAPSAIGFQNLILSGRYVYSGANWNILLDYGNRKMGFGQDGGGYPQFTKVFTANTWYNITFVVAPLYVQMDYKAGADTGTQTIVKTAGGGFGGVGDYVIRLGGYIAQCHLQNFEMLDAIATPTQLQSYLDGTKLSASSGLLIDVPLCEESGEINYDFSPNKHDFIAELTSGWCTQNPCLHIVTGLTGNEQSISYDMTTIPPGTNVTITASRVKAGFPTGRTPDISTESDTATFTVAPVSVTGITLNKASALLDIGDTTTLTATVWPKG